jgi:hypothetical protein
MENLKNSYKSTWSKEQSSTVNTIEQKYRKRMFLADVQGLKVDKKEQTGQKCKEIKAILSSSQYNNYLNFYESN